MSPHFLPNRGKLGFEIVDFPLDGGEVDGGLLLEGIARILGSSLLSRLIADILPPCYGCGIDAAARP